MLLAAFRALFVQFAVISAICAAAAGLAWFVGGPAAANDVMNIGIWRMKGPWVWTFGWGLAAFVAVRGPLIALDVGGLFEPGDVVARAVLRVDRACRHRFALKFTIPITIIGVISTVGYALPTQGVPYAILFAGICSIYYVGAFLLFHFVEVVMAFNDLLEGESDVSFRRLYSPLHLENLTSYLGITTALGLLGIYAGFRGTLTAGFAFQQDFWKVFLTVPLILFLPGTLFYNYYPRYVLRKLLQHKVFQTMERLSRADDLSVRDLILDLREAVAATTQTLPFLDYKSLPGYLLAIFFGLSLAYNSDPAVKAFVSSLLGLDSP